LASGTSNANLPASIWTTRGTFASFEILGVGPCALWVVSVPRAGFLGAATAIVTARWNRRAVLSEEAIAALKQQMDLIKQQATQTETNLKEQLAYYKELSPADIQKERIQTLEEKLETSNRLLREKTAEVSANKIGVATAMGYGKIFLGVNDAELLARALAGLITSCGKIIDFGEVDLSVKSFYIGFMRLLVRNDIFLEQFIGISPEWILDYVILPMLACAKYKTLEPVIEETLGRVFVEMQKTPYSAEVPIYMEALQRAKSGQDFSSLNLPTDLGLKLTNASSS
jgi:hypothetical protein